MADNKNQESEFNFEMFLTDDGAQILSDDRLKDLKKNLPTWDIKPPQKYNEKKKTDA